MIASFLPEFGGAIWTVLAFVVALSVIVAIHEYGHYIVGRWCGIKADVFSVGFGPVIWSKMDRHGTQWQVAALPLGGYVKFRGDSDAASMGSDVEMLSLSAEERAQTMTGAALWRRAATVAAGPVFNFVLSILIFAGFVLVLGRAVDRPVVGELVALPPGVETLAPGDEVLAIGDVPIEAIGDLAGAGATAPDGATLPYDVRRDGARIEVEAAPPMPARAAQVQPRSAAWDVGIRTGDVIVAVDGTPVHSFQGLQEATRAADGAPITVDVWRPGEAGGETLRFTVTPRSMAIPLADGGFETRYLIGISGGLFFEPVTERAGPLEALAYGVGQTWYILSSSISALGHIVTGQISTCNLSGPIGIAETSGAAASQGFETFVWFIAGLSAAVGMLNLFPIPVLDGGHLVFHAYEAVRGRPPSDGAVRVLMTAGIAMMGMLMVFALWNDIFC
ncbi:RIP metalloprotease RseP [uncultured Jannaschia sp.]|uniref:RIP metalloprotease RseP n=1 Tax=uncultured Jannaschia sp. TaxID=293347 RepID=UPI002625F464|nr:RIP metalloprotease RseP [uncultured Jannaschia sp.]